MDPPWFGPPIQAENPWTTPPTIDELAANSGSGGQTFTSAAAINTVTGDPYEMFTFHPNRRLGVLNSNAKFKIVLPNGDFADETKPVPLTVPGVTDAPPPDTASPVVFTIPGATDNGGLSGQDASGHGGMRPCSRPASSHSIRKRTSRRMCLACTLRRAWRIRSSLRSSPSKPGRLSGTITSVNSGRLSSLRSQTEHVRSRLLTDTVPG
jgi:hypothetical protein